MVRVFSRIGALDATASGINEPKKENIVAALRYGSTTMLGSERGCLASYTREFS